MLSFKQFIEEEDIVAKLKNHYLRYPLEKRKENRLEDLIQKTLRLDESNFDDQKIDKFSSIYEKEILFKDRRKSGEIYTPTNIVQYILKEIGYNERNSIIEKTIIDISCGVGSFLIESVKILKKVLLKSYKNEDIKILEGDKLIQIFDTMTKRIYGADSNPIACFLCQLNLFYSLMDLIRAIKAKKPWSSDI